jgi:hypothetical protein
MSCKDVLQEPDLQKVTEELASKIGASHPDKCYRLNDNEFLVTVQAAGLGDGLYVFDVNENSIEQYESMPGIRVVKEFDGKQGQRYVLFRAGRLLHGYCTGGYNILQLASNQESGETAAKHRITAHQRALKDLQPPVEVYNLFFTSLGADCGGCAEYTEGERSIWAVASKITGYRIFNEGSDDVKIVFDLKEQDCKTLKLRDYQKKFSLREGRFSEE